MRLQPYAKITNISLKESSFDNINTKVVTETNTIIKLLEKYQNYQKVILDQNGENITRKELSTLLFNISNYKQ